MTGAEKVGVDWTQPLELTDGTPVVLRNTGFKGGPNPDSDGDYWVAPEGGGLFPNGSDSEVVGPDGLEGSNGTEVRNRASSARVQS